MEREITNNDSWLLAVTYNTGVKHTRLGVERVDSWVDTELGDGTRQHSRGVQVGEGGCRSGIRQIVSRDIDSLH